jgi:hypothetical protein
MILIFIEAESTIFPKIGPFIPRSSARHNKTPPPNDGVVAHPSSAVINRLTTIHLPSLILKSASTQ